MDETAEENLEADRRLGRACAALPELAQTSR